MTGVNETRSFLLLRPGACAGIPARSCLWLARGRACRRLLLLPNDSAFSTDQRARREIGSRFQVSSPSSLRPSNLDPFHSLPSSPLPPLGSTPLSRLYSSSS